ncbi:MULTISPECIES: DUF736 domain-containing protein [unclassified Novosphingobium]|uniref:DUF736 domain-containing protein n=1 Tax=unclassified Novosphingobium TaxID=2644732 RepID=UPI001045AE7C|nr:MULTISPECIES: DUF736 domain-containing protein [unclassified Novosphingobium]MPS71378.1 DUF736 domain-containing protein [Novosphingobium sp.]TCM28139.1 uncharacterized protein (DUF736 family) [Novosphingobium sp. ST904]
MNIGTFKVINGQLLGSIATVSIDLPRLGMRPVESDNDKAPAYEIVALNVARRWVQVGALWEATSNSTGEVFYQGRLEDPSLTEPLQIMLFGDNEEGYRVVWNRQTPRRENMDGSRQTRRRQRDDGFGEGNATEDGRIAEDLNDEIPAF